jgi:NAD(P)-dependent dehydrogenase (short-subunit alcohol dehydrogenase family)
MNAEQPVRELVGRTAIVVGAGRGLGRGIATALADAGAPVVAVARDGHSLESLAHHHPGITSEVADASDATVAGRLIDEYEPEVVVVVAGAVPYMRPLQQQTWETFTINWQSDVRIAFHWLREALLKPLRPDSRVIVVSSGAALAGSPLSGGYAGAKATQRFMAGYAQTESLRSGLQISFATVLPSITPLTGVGRPAVRAYAKRNGESEKQYMEHMGEPLTPQVAGAAIVDLVREDQTTLAAGYLLTGVGLTELPVERDGKRRT